MSKPKVLIFVMVLLVIVSACQEQDHLSFPSIQLESSQGLISTDTILSAGESMSFGITATGDSYTLTNFYISVNGAAERVVFDTGMNTPALQWTGEFIRGFDPEEQWTFVIRDRWGNSAQEAILIGLDSGVVFRPLSVRQGILLGAQQNNTSGSFYSISGNEVYGISECNGDSSVQQMLDLVHYFGPDLSTIASPGANIEQGIFIGDFQGWTFRNTTRFIPMYITEEQFTAYNNDSILIAMYDDSQAKRKAKELKNGDTFVFKTQDGTLGMFLVKEVGEGPMGYMIFDLKFRE